MAEQPPFRYERTWDAATIQEDFAALEPGPRPSAASP